MYVMRPDLSKPRAVDVHFHVFHAHVAQPGARYVPGYDAPLAAWQAAAAPLGITRGVLVQPSFLGSDHRRTRTELAAHPDTLRGVAVLTPDTPPAELARLHALGVRAIRLNLVGTDVEGFRILAPAVLGAVAVVISPTTLQSVADDSGCALLRGSLIITWPTGRTSSQPLELQIEGIA